jgi:hypothetical protein
VEDIPRINIDFIIILIMVSEKKLGGITFIPFLLHMALGNSFCCRLRVLENRVLRRIIGCRRVHNKEFYALYSLPDIIWVIKSKRTEMGSACSKYGGNEMCIQGFSGET